MTLQTRLAALAAALGADYKSLNADLQSFKLGVPTNEDMLFSVMPTTGILSASTPDFIGVMPFNATILSMDFVFYGAVATSDTNYWNIDLNAVGPGTVVTQLVRGSTQATGASSNGPIVSQQDWNYNALTWSTRNVNAGDVLRVNYGRVGAPSNLAGNRAVTIRYQRR